MNKISVIQGYFSLMIFLYDLWFIIMNIKFFLRNSQISLSKGLGSAVNEMFLQLKTRLRIIWEVTVNCEYFTFILGLGSDKVKGQSSGIVMYIPCS
jgi:hypothetical protein